MKYFEQEGIVETKGAIFSDNMKYRYTLSRVWDNDLPLVAFIGLNPSTANANIDDPTIRRCRNFAKSWGYGGLIMVNLYAYRSTDPKLMLKAIDPVGFDNDQFIKNAMECSKMIVFAWGGNAEVDRALNVIQFVPDGHCLGKNANGSPKHPLYIKGDTNLEPYNGLAMC